MSEETISATAGKNSTVPTRTRNRIGWLLIAYFASILLINLWTLLARDDRLIRSQIPELLAFSITAIMISVARSWLQSFRFDRLSLVAFLLFGTFLRIPRRPTDGFETGLTYCAFLPVALVLVILLVRSRSEIRHWAGLRLDWLAGGLVLGIALGGVVLIGSSLVYRQGSLPQPSSEVTTLSVVLTFLYVMGHTAILEEPVGRGFLWGFLEQRQWTPATIWTFQAAVFWVLHLRHLDSPITFWIALPMGGLMLGWLSWKSGSVAAGLIAHAAYNTIGAYF